MTRVYGYRNYTRYMTCLPLLCTVHSAMCHWRDNDKGLWIWELHKIYYISPTFVHSPQCHVPLERQWQGFMDIGTTQDIWHVFHFCTQSTVPCATGEIMTRVYGCGNYIRYMTCLPLLYTVHSAMCHWRDNDKGLWLWELHKIYDMSSTFVHSPQCHVPLER